MQILERLSEVAREQWAAREQRTRADITALRARLEGIRRLNSAAIKAKLTGDLSADDFDSLKATNAEDTSKIEQEITALESERNMMQEFIEQNERDLVDLVGAWKKADVSGKKELQTALFPDGLVWDHENGFLNHKNVSVIDGLGIMIQGLENLDAGLIEFIAKIGVPITDIFEHLDATIAEATPLYELCASVLSSAPALRLQSP